MVRTALPGGRLSSGQLLAALDLCDQFGNGMLRITNRQSLQLHGLRKRDLTAALRLLHEAGLSTFAASGDVLRNVMCCPAPYCQDPVHGQLQWMAGHLAAAMRRARPPIGKSGWAKRRRPTLESEVEPMYGASYLPRKVKVAIGLPGDNCVDIYSQDVGLLALCENFQVVGYNVLVGGGMGVTPRNPDTFPALAQPMARIRPEQVVEVVRRHPVRLSRLRQPQRSLPGAAAILDRGLGAGRVQGAGRGPLGLSAASARAGRSLGHRRPHRLARAGRRPLVPWPACAGRADCRRAARRG